jgi:hypothetical protein
MHTTCFGVTGQPQVYRLCSCIPITTIILDIILCPALYFRHDVLKTEYGSPEHQDDDYVQNYDTYINVPSLQPVDFNCYSTFSLVIA